MICRQPRLYMKYPGSHLHANLLKWGPRLVRSLCEQESLAPRRQSSRELCGSHPCARTSRIGPTATTTTQLGISCLQRISHLETCWQDRQCIVWKLYRGISVEAWKSSAACPCRSCHCLNWRSIAAFDLPRVAEAVVGSKKVILVSNSDHISLNSSSAELMPRILPRPFSCLWFPRHTAVHKRTKLLQVVVQNQLKQHS